jgi:hypothetical protein
MVDPFAAVYRTSLELENTQETDIPVPFSFCCASSAVQNFVFDKLLAAFLTKFAQRIEIIQKYGAKCGDMRLNALLACFLSSNCNKALE